MSLHVCKMFTNNPKDLFAHYFTAQTTGPMSHTVKKIFE
jgi:hypothetical protein